MTSAGLRMKATTRSRHKYTGHNYAGHTCIGHNYTGLRMKATTRSSLSLGLCHRPAKEKRGSADTAAGIVRNSFLSIPRGEIQDTFRHVSLTRTWPSLSQRSDCGDVCSGCTSNHKCVQFVFKSPLHHHINI